MAKRIGNRPSAGRLSLSVRFYRLLAQHCKTTPPDRRPAAGDRQQEETTRALAKVSPIDGLAVGAEKAEGIFSEDEDLLAEVTKRQRSGKPFGGVIYAHQLGITIGRSINALEILAPAGAGEAFLRLSDVMAVALAIPSHQGRRAVYRCLQEWQW